MDASAALLGLTLLVIGENQIATPGYLLNPLHDALQARGAVVHSYGMCGGYPTRWLNGPPTDCGAAVRTREEPAQVIWADTPHRHNLREIVAHIRPSAAVIVIHETLAAYAKPDIDRPLAQREVETLAQYFAQEGIACYWVGPAWGEPNKRFNKAPERVHAVAEFIKTYSHPCQFIDSRPFAQPGDWKTTNGRDYTTKGYRAWAQAISDAIVRLASHSRSNSSHQ